jgi:hypothetical protein
MIASPVAVLGPTAFSVLVWGAVAIVVLAVLFILGALLRGRARP